MSQRMLSGFDIDTDAFATELRRLADGIERNEVHLKSVDGAQVVSAADDIAEFGLSFDFVATTHYADVVEMVQFATEQYLKFDDDLVDDVLDWSHTTTIRYDLERDFDVGDTVALVNEAGDTFDHATVAGVYELTVEQAVEQEIEPHHTVADLVERLRNLYETYDIHADTVVTAIQLEDVGEGDDDV